MIFLAVYISDNCTTCARVVASAKSIVKQCATIHLQVKNISELTHQCKIVPAIYVNDKLFCYGDFDKKKLIEQITKR